MPSKKYAYTSDCFAALFAFLLPLQNKCAFVINRVPLKCVKYNSKVTWETYLFHRTHLYSRCCCKICRGRGGVQQYCYALCESGYIVSAVCSATVLLLESYYPRNYLTRESCVIPGTFFRQHFELFSP
jgi:hypothetical protein